jgi:prepilin-type N-terminal cleavage/methylation domain-containing protein
MRSPRPDVRRSLIKPGQQGITLIEMMVVLAILGLLVGSLTVGYARLPGTALKREGVKLAAALRSAYDRATASGAHHRVIIDIAKGTFFVERCEGKVQVRKVRDLKEEVERQRLEAEKQARMSDAQSNEALLGAMTKDAGQRLGGSGGGAGASCTPVSGELGKKQTLGGTPKVSFHRVFVAHLQEPAKDGVVSLNFFPLGTAERAVIELSVGEEEQFSIAVRPLSGRIDMGPGEWRDVDDVVHEDAEGKQQ